MTDMAANGQGTPVSETDRLDPRGTELVLHSGMKVRVVRLRMRQLFRLLRIITRGGAGFLPILRDALTGAEEGQAAEVFGTQLLAIALMALPEAEDEAVDFFLSVCDPVDLIDRDDKQANENNAQLRQKVAKELFNPEIEDAVSIMECIVRTEREDLVALGKRLAAAWGIAAKTGQVPEATSTSESSDPTLTSLPDSPELSTSSHQSMAGTTV